ncbi:phosphopantetheine-binding protein [Streptomyces sp. NBC_01506]|uniref:phosphopantetheine-binding protein n=1 Tax=Streptomyces sp. NBC_01506 TaxID=2903887 RepID=UPI003867889B
MTTGPTTHEATGTYRQRVAEIWSTALGTQVTTEDHQFFADGGDSFQAALATATVRREWGLEITVQLLIDHPVLKDFADRVAQLAAQLADDRAR